MIWKIFAVFFLLAGLYHFAGIFTAFDHSPAWRHGFFILINFTGLYGCLKRPAWFLYFILILSIQQFYSHGTFLVQYYRQTKQVHLLSAAVLVLLPVLLVLLIKERKNK